MFKDEGEIIIKGTRAFQAEIARLNKKNEGLKAQLYAYQQKEINELSASVGGKHIPLEIPFEVCQSCEALRFDKLMRTKDIKKTEGPIQVPCKSCKGIGIVWRRHQEENFASVEQCKCRDCNGIGEK